MRAVVGIELDRYSSRKPRCQFDGCATMMLSGAGAVSNPHGNRDLRWLIGTSTGQVDELGHERSSFSSPFGSSRFGKRLPHCLPDHRDHEAFSDRDGIRILSKASRVARPPRFPRHRSLVDRDAAHEIGASMRCRERDVASVAVPEDHCGSFIEKSEEILDVAFDVEGTRVISRFPITTSVVTAHRTPLASEASEASHPC